MSSSRIREIETVLFLDRRAFWGYLGFAVLCGLAAVISLPPARSVSTFGSFLFLQDVPVYFHVFLFALTLLAVRDGLVGADRGQTGWRGDAAQLMRGVLALILVLPLAILQLGLHPGRMGSMLLFFLFALSIWWAVGSMTRWLAGAWGRRWALAVAYGWIAGYWCLSFAAERSIVTGPIRVAGAWFGGVGAAGAALGMDAVISWSSALSALGLPILWGIVILALLHRSS
ncbi:hypothetical protein JW848_06540 [Candidatus Bipolaricaulota bacterium]|nr:hypothetical protein [Candidatus Bipolaricaulota bacterium]